MPMSWTLLIVSLAGLDGTEIDLPSAVVASDTASMLQMPDQRRQPCSTIASSTHDLMEDKLVKNLIANVQEVAETVTVGDQDVTAIRITNTAGGTFTLEHNEVKVAVPTTTPDIEGCVVVFTWDGKVEVEFSGCSPTDFLVTFPQSQSFLESNLLQVTNERQPSSCNFCQQSNEGTQNISLPVAQNDNTVTCLGQSQLQGTSTFTLIEVSCESVVIDNPDFEIGVQNIGNYKYFRNEFELDGWGTIGGVVIVKTNKAPWGKITASNGNYLLALQRSGSSVAQSVEFEKGSCYVLTVSVAQRKNSPKTEDEFGNWVHPMNANLKVSVGVDALLEFNPQNPPSSDNYVAMLPHTMVFIAQEKNMPIMFENTLYESNTSNFTVEPPDQTVLIDGITVIKANNTVCGVAN